MSATARGTERDPKDFYPTPWPAFSPLLPLLPREVPIHDPCAGDGRIVRWLRESGRICTGADLFPDYGQTVYVPTATDYLLDTTIREFVSTNPPFSLAFEMCQHARTHSREFMFLLRLSFLESEERGDWLAANEPSALFVLRKRPSFVMSITCKTRPKVTVDDDQRIISPEPCRHNWLRPIESERPKFCPKCGGENLSISTSDNSGYSWFYWGDRFKGIHHI